MSTQPTVLHPAPGSLRAHVAAEIRAWRGRLGLSQAQLAAIIGVTQPAVSARLTGRQSFTLDELELLAERFGIPVWELLVPRQGAGFDSGPGGGARSALSGTGPLTSPDGAAESR